MVSSRNMIGNNKGTVPEKKKEKNPYKSTWADEAFFPRNSPFTFFTSSPYTTNKRRLPTPLINKDINASLSNFRS
jgi:hypothetical protein